jgi:peptidoglycan/LPS O-acetylase OafA/YrhL
LFGLILVIGLAGVLIPRTRTAVGALAWAAAALVMILPVAEHEYTYRYVVPAVPLACLAAALAARNRGKDTSV